MKTSVFAVIVLTLVWNVCERLLWGCKWMDIQLMNLEQAYEMGLELLSFAKRLPFCRCREQICELPAT